MQHVKLPLTINAVRAAQKRLNYTGSYSPRQIARVAECVVSVDSDVEATMSFDIDDQRRVVIKGYLNVKLTLICQRCSGTFQHSLAAGYSLSPVTDDEQAIALPAACEPVEIDKFGVIDLLAMIEDEIILSLPVVALHESGYCKMKDVVFGQLPDDKKKPNPFSVLTSLKK